MGCNEEISAVVGLWCREDGLSVSVRENKGLKDLKGRDFLSHLPQSDLIFHSQTIFA